MFNLFLFFFKFVIKFLIINFFIYFSLFFWIFQINDEINYIIVIKLLEQYKLITFIEYVSNKINVIENGFLSILTVYYSILYYLFICFIISIVLFSLSYFFFIKPVKFNEKLLPYECGFDPFDDARKQFDILFYLIALYFIIFDIEAIFIFPWTVSFFELTSLGFYNMIDFFLELSIALYYLIYTDSLD